MCVETTKEARACQLSSLSPSHVTSVIYDYPLLSFSVILILHEGSERCSWSFRCTAGAPLMLDDGGGGAAAAATPLLFSTTVNSFSSGSFQGQTTDYTLHYIL